MAKQDLSFRSRKALSVHLGESAGHEIANLIQRLADRIEYLERNKVDVTPIAPTVALPVDTGGLARRAA